MQRLMKRFKIRTQISIIYIAVFVFTFVATFSLIFVLNQKYTENEVGDAGVQTVSALKGNLSFIFDNVTQFSNLIYFDDTIQQSLNNITTDNINPEIHTDIQRGLFNIILSGDYISSTTIFDKYYNNYTAYKVGPILIDQDKVVETDWYEESQNAKGNGFFIHKSEEILTFPTRPNKNYISYVRQIGNSDTYEPIATLLVTIEAETIQEYFDEIAGDYESQFFIVDSSGEYIIPPVELAEEYGTYIKHNLGKESQTGRINDENVVVVQQELEIQDWILVGSFKTDSIAALAPYYSTIIVIIVFLNIFTGISCAMWLTRLIFNPLEKIGAQMKLVEQGQFTKMVVDENTNEINNLKRMFNHMTDSIQNLIGKVKEEEQVIAKGKVDLINAQINPHFLYNTLDAVSALALLGDNENCFKMTQALGSFYRNSLNSGLDFITIEDEIHCINSYMTILNTRYEGKIQIHCDVEEEVEHLPVLKLLLQPVIENAVHHGIKQNGGEGNVYIKIYKDEEEVIFIISDDGCGMEEERIQEILEGKVQTGKSGFGIHSLIERVRLYYGIENPVTIHSEIGSGTEVTIRIDSTKGSVK